MNLNNCDVSPIPSSFSFSSIECDDCHDGAKDHHDSGDDGDGHVDASLHGRVRAGLPVECCGENERDGDARQGARNRQKTVQFVIDGKGNHARENHDKGTTDILAELSLASFRPRTEKPIFDDQVCRVDHQGVRKEQIQREKHLQNVGDDTLLGQLVRDEGRRQLVTPRNDHQFGPDYVKDSQQCNGDAEHFVVVGLILGHLHNRQYDPNTFKGVNCEADRVREQLAVEHFHVVKLGTLLAQSDCCIYSQS